MSSAKCIYVFVCIHITVEQENIGTKYGRKIENKDEQLDSIMATNEVSDASKG